MTKESTKEDLALFRTYIGIGMASTLVISGFAFQTQDVEYVYLSLGLLLVVMVMSFIHIRVSKTLD